jgi:hypothetical protein
MRTLFRLALFASAGVAALLLAGCGDPLNRGGDVHGRVTIDGEPVTAGNVLMVSEDGKWTGIGPINASGDYVVKEPPLGKVKIAVQTEMYRDAPPPPKPGGKDGSPMVPPDPSVRGTVYKAIPRKYEQIDSAELSCTVVQGQQPFDLKLTWK